MNQHLLLHTVTGSYYQIDLLNKKIRRLQNSSPKQNHKIFTGKWQSYLGINEPKLNHRMVIIWGNGDIPVTQTSPIASINYIYLTEHSN